MCWTLQVRPLCTAIYEQFNSRLCHVHMETSFVWMGLKLFQQLKWLMAVNPLGLTFSWETGRNEYLLVVNSGLCSFCLELAKWLQRLCHHDSVKLKQKVYSAQGVQYTCVIGNCLLHAVWISQDTRKEHSASSPVNFSFLLINLFKLPVIIIIVMLIIIFFTVILQIVITCNARLGLQRFMLL